MLRNNNYSCTRNSLLFIAKLTIALVAYIYIIIRIFHNIKLFSQNILVFQWDFSNYCYLAIGLFLMPLNWLIESYKWKILVKPLEHLSICQSVKGVLFSLTFAVFTPYRLGELAGRPMMLSEKNRVPGIIAAFVGSIAQSSVTTCMGGMGLLLLLSDKIYTKTGLVTYSSLIGTITLIMFFSLLWLYFHPDIFLSIANKISYLRKREDKFAFIKKYSKTQLLYILFLSQIRYLIFFSQYYLLINAFEIEISLLQAFSAISLSYLFLFTIPGIPIAELGIRGSLALFFIGIYSNSHLSIVAASTALWIINLAFPSMIGSIFIYKRK